MSASLLDAAITAARAEFIVQLADTPALVEEAYRLRYQVYCLERGYEPAQGGREVDGYDGHSSHVLLRLAASSLAIGTARLIVPDTARPRDSFPMQGLIAGAGFPTIPFMRMAEVSRLSISKEWRGPSTAASSVLYLALVRGLVQLSYQQGLTHWCAVMERTLLRLLQRSGIHFLNMGPLVEYHGLRQPAYCNLAHMLARMREEQPSIWGFVTEHGAHVANSGKAHSR